MHKLLDILFLHYIQMIYKCPSKGLGFLEDENGGGHLAVSLNLIHWANILLILCWIIQHQNAQIFSLDLCVLIFGQLGHAEEKRKAEDSTAGKAGGQVYRVINPTDSVPDVVLVLPFEYQPPIAVVLLGWAIQLPIHVGAMKDHSILVGVDSLALQGVINVVPLQGADGERKKTAVENWSPLRGEPKALTLGCQGEKQELVYLGLQRQETHSTLSSGCAARTQHHSSQSHAWHFL